LHRKKPVYSTPPSLKELRSGRQFTVEEKMKPEIGGQPFDKLRTGDWKSEVRRLDDGGLKSEIRDLRSEVGGLRSEVGSRRSEVIHLR
jgi:hypothetical protein